MSLEQIQTAIGIHTSTMALGYRTELLGPKPASTHDVIFFRGGKEVSKSKKKNEAQWDKKSLYFKIPKGKKLIGDSAR